MKNDPNRPSDLAGLERLMLEKGLVIRAVPYVTRHVLEASHVHEYPYGRVGPVPGRDRPMLVYYDVHPYAGRFLVESCPHTCSSVRFRSGRTYGSIADAVAEACDPNAGPPAERPCGFRTVSLSDRHVSRETRDMLRRCAESEENPFRAGTDGRGVLMPVPAPGIHFPEDLANCVALAMSRSARFLSFEPGRTLEDELPVYD